MQKTLTQKDSRTLGYFALSVAIVGMFLNALMGSTSGWSTLILSFFGMLSIATIAQAGNPNFLTSNRLLLPILMIGLGLVPVTLTVHRWITEGFTLNIDIVGLIFPILVVTMFSRYVKENGIEPEIESRQESR